MEIIHQIDDSGTNDIPIVLESQDRVHHFESAEEDRDSFQLNHFELTPKLENYFGP